MSRYHTISSDPLELHHIRQLLDERAQLRLSDQSRERILHCRSFLEMTLATSDHPFYGINTGFGALHNIRISKEQSESLQEYLVKSHACGTGEQVPEEVVQLMILLKIQSLSYGHSGIRLTLVERLIDFYNAGIYPVIYQQGSLGASGDLAPLAHLSLALIGEGDVHYQGQQRPAAEVLRELGISPLQLQAKEGLALLNGTQFSTAYGLWSVLRAFDLFHTANLCAALSIDAYNCHLAPFDDRIHRIRPQAGQILVAEEIRGILQGSSLSNREKDHVQDPYAFRCVPQVHGASRDAIAYVQQVVGTEINAVTDNPNIFPDSEAIISGGNFHAQPIALALDFLAIALAELGSISERRTYQLLSGQRGLPTFLTPKPGLNSGLMIPQYTAASIVSQNKQLCTPASIDSIVSSNGQEDHVSMAANAATKLYRVTQNLQTILAIEWLTAAQALTFRRPDRSSDQLEKLITQYRQHVLPIEEDRIFSTDIGKTKEFLRTLRFGMEER